MFEPLKTFANCAVMTAQFAKVFRGSNIKFNIKQSSKQPFFKRNPIYSTSDLINSAQRIYYTRCRRNHQHQCVAKLSQPIQGVFYTCVGLGDAICLPLLVKRRRRRRPVPPWSWLRDRNETALCVTDMMHQRGVDLHSQIAFPSSAAVKTSPYMMTWGA